MGIRIKFRSALLTTVTGITFGKIIKCRWKKRPNQKDRH